MVVTQTLVLSATSPSPEPSPSSEPTPTTTVTECGLSADSPCYTVDVAGTWDPLWIGLGLLVLLVALIAAAQVRRP